MHQISYPTISDPDLPFLVAQVSIHSNHENAPLEATAGYVDGQTTPRLLYGNLVSSPHILRNLQGRQGVYFLFPDVSVRVRGQYYLDVTLLKIPRYLSSFARAAMILWCIQLNYVLDQTLRNLCSVADPVRRFPKLGLCLSTSSRAQTTRRLVRQV